MSPTDYFEFVIGDVARTTWTYGPSFTIWCDAASYNPKLIYLTEAEAQTIVAAANIINKIPPLKGIVFNSIFLPDSSGS